MIFCYLATLDRRASIILSKNRRNIFKIQFKPITILQYINDFQRNIKVVAEFKAEQYYSKKANKRQNNQNVAHKKYPIRLNEQ